MKNNKQLASLLSTNIFKKERICRDCIHAFKLANSTTNGVCEVWTALPENPKVIDFYDNQGTCKHFKNRWKNK